MKLRQMIAQKKLKASTAVRRTNASTRAAAMEEEEEPTMRLSTAFVVVLLLHLVAIGGVYTFDAVKVNRPAATAEADAADLEKNAPISHAAALASAGQETAPSTTAAASSKTTITTTTTSTSTKPTAPAATKTAAATQTVANTSAPSASGKVHTVEKGENPVVIARKYGVDYDDLLALNKIDDPRRLRIGQKLQIPTK